MTTYSLSKNRVIAIASICLLFLLILTCIPTSFALTGDAINEWKAEWNTWHNECSQAGGALGEFAFDVGSAAVGGNPYLSTQVIATDIFKIGSWSVTFKGGTTFSLVSSAQLMYEYMKVVGIALIFLYFLIEILDEVQADNFNIEHLIKKLITLAVAIIVLNNGSAILTTIIDFGDAMLTDATVVGGDPGRASAKEIRDEVVAAGNADGLFSAVSAALVALGIILKNIIGYLLSYVAILIVYLVSFSRYIEILVRFAFAPLGCAQLVSGGSKSAGMRYIKKFAACVLQGGVCVVAFSCQAILQTASTGLNAVLSQVLLPLTMIGFILKSGKIADDVFGV